MLKMNAREVLYPGEVLRDMDLDKVIERFMLKKFQNWVNQTYLDEKKNNA